MEKSSFPVVVAPEVKVKRSKKHVILTSWASVATALLLVVLIGGAFYVADLRGRQCNGSSTGGPNKDLHNQKAYEKTYEEDDNQTKEDFYLDDNSQTELILKKTVDGNIEAIAEIDYKMKIAAVYLPAADKCVLAAGVQLNWLDEWISATENKTADQLQHDQKTVTYAVTENKVTDLSILPDGMIPFCKGKGTYWMQPDNDSDSGERQKRQVKVETETTTTITLTCGCKLVFKTKKVEYPRK